MAISCLCTSTTALTKSPNCCSAILRSSSRDMAALTICVGMRRDHSMWPPPHHPSPRLPSRGERLGSNRPSPPRGGEGTWRASCEVSGGCSSEPPVGSLWLPTQAHPTRGGSDERPPECPDHTPESSRDCSPHRRRAPVHRTGRRRLRDQCADGPQVGRAGRVGG